MVLIGTIPGRSEDEHMESDGYGMVVAVEEALVVSCLALIVLKLTLTFSCGLLLWMINSQ